MQQVQDSRGNIMTSEQTVECRCHASELRELEDLRRDNRKLIHDLRVTEKELIKQRKLKDVFIGRSKNQRKELDKLHYYNDEEQLCMTKITSLVRNKNKIDSRRNLEEDYEELQVVYMMSQENQTKELQQEKEKRKDIQEELDDLKVDYKNISFKYDTQVPALRQQVDLLNLKLEREMQSNADRVLEDQQVIFNLRAEQDALRLEKNEEINTLQQISFEKEWVLMKEVEELKTQLRLQKLCQENEEAKEAEKVRQEKFPAELKVERQKNKLLEKENQSIRVLYNELRERSETAAISVEKHSDEMQFPTDEVKNQENQQLINNLKAEQDTFCENMAEERNILKEGALEKEDQLKDKLEKDLQPQTEIACCEEENETRSYQQQEESCSDAPVVELQEEPEVPESTQEPEVSETTPAPSRWKRFRHSIGLRKPQRWKKKKPTTPHPQSADPNLTSV